MKKLTIVLYLVGFVFIGLSVKKLVESSIYKNESNKFLLVNELFDLKNFLHSDKYKIYGDNIEIKPNHITALYVITSVSCSVCINEIIKYNHFFNDKTILDKSIQQFVVLVEKDNNKALRLVKTTEFVTPVIYGYDTQYLINLLSFGKATSKRQLLLIDNDSKKIFFKTLLPLSKPTDISYKEKIIREAKISLNQIGKMGEINQNNQSASRE